jgi:hypothetical protein
MSQQTFEDGKTAARQNKYASKLAGMFWWLLLLLRMLRSTSHM